MNRGEVVMLRKPDRSELLGRWRQLLFYTWVVAAMVALIAAAVGGPLTSTDGTDGTSVIAIISPIAMAVFLITGLAWLVLLVFYNRSPYEQRPPP
jgi:hypothetical protein